MCECVSHTLNIWERVVGARLRAQVTISGQQCGFMPGRRTSEAMFALRMLIEKYREGQTELRCVFVDLEKAYDRVPRDELWCDMRKSECRARNVREESNSCEVCGRNNGRVYCCGVVEPGIGMTDGIRYGLCYLPMTW
ncbi:uncharacterized protein LOC122267384 [Penaeus japonicus]|uniref:uncharacterized protein LOC122267384 n=1 Tax=Penaeus japonicus TaxID=27405 RepID=UPI001C7116AB|nr:uncharacterized protein LOC122267384 [Penaeus japonicus]